MGAGLGLDLSPDLEVELGLVNSIIKSLYLCYRLRQQTLRPFLRAHISINKACNPINLGVKWKLLLLSFQWCPQIWNLDLNWLRYAIKHDGNRMLQWFDSNKNESSLIHFKWNFLNHFWIKYPFSCAYMKAENLRILKLSLL